MPLDRLPQPLRHVAHHVKRYGVAITLREAIPFLKEAILRREERLEAREAFDARFGTDTGGELWPWDLASQADTTSDANYYQALAASAIDAALDHVDAPLPSKVFIDLGAGKGRAVMVAALRPFKTVIGVELAPELHAAGLHNIRHFEAQGHARAAIDMRLGDASAVAFPDAPLVVFMYNPFGPDTLAKVLANIDGWVARTQKSVTLLYANPVCAAVIRRNDRWRIDVDQPALLVANRVPLI